MEHDSSVRLREQRNVRKGSPGRFPFHPNVRFEFSATSSSEWNSVFQNFPKKDNLARYRVFSHDVTAAILVSQNNETAAMFVSQTSPLGVEPFLMQTLSFVPVNLHSYWPRE